MAWLAGCSTQEPHHGVQHVSVSAERVRLGGRDMDAAPAELALAPDLYEALSSIHKAQVPIELGGWLPLTVTFTEDTSCTRFLSVVATIAHAGYPRQIVQQSGRVEVIDYATDAAPREARVLTDMDDSEQLTVYANPCYAAVEQLPAEGLGRMAAQLAATAGPDARVVFEPRCDGSDSMTQVMSSWQRLSREPALQGRAVFLRAPSDCRHHRAHVEQLGLDRKSSAAPTADEEPGAPPEARPDVATEGTMQIAKLALEPPSERDEASARAALEALGSRLLGCYAARQARDRNAGAFTVRLTFGSAGGVIDRPRGGGTFEDIAVVGCMTRAIVALTLPASPRALTTLSTELTFTP